MPNSDEFMDHLLDLLSEAGPIAPRRMFGGHGLFIDGVMIGLVASDTLYLKVDDHSQPDFEAAGMGPFTYESKNGKRGVMSYFEALPDAMEDPEALAGWVRSAHDAALRAQSKKKPKEKRT